MNASNNTNIHQLLRVREAEVIALRAEVARLRAELFKQQDEDDVMEDPNYA